ncbi:MAG: hypothetical protein HY758_08930, partial [Nitrospirae bacterium]|nr:hypothetical protein [Nitrospirota bacterium]
MKIKTMTNILITVIVLLACTSAEAGHHRHSRSGPSDPSISSEAYAEEEHYNAVRYPYGRSKKGAYGERQSVMTEDEARTSLKEYFENN